MTTTPSAQNHWQRAITSVMRRVNAVAWLERFAPAVFACGALGALVFYALRRLHVSAAVLGWAWLGLVVAIFVTALIAWRLARRAFFSRADARAFLEYQLRIDSRLSAADAGAAGWPRAMTNRQSVLRWKPRVTLGWFAAAIVLLAAGLCLPVSRTSLPVIPVEKPPALAQAEEWLKDLAQTNAVDPQSLENLEAQARELASKPSETQYTHSALEAADALREQAAQAMQSLAREFEGAESTLSSLASAQQSLNESGEPLSEEQIQRAADQLAKALHGMNEGTLAASKELTDALQKLDASSLRELSAEEAAKLAKQMGKAGKAVQLVMGKEGTEGGKDAMAALVAALESSDGKPVRMRGNGDVSRGRGDAPLDFDRRESNAGAGTMQTVQNDDYSRAALGDKLGVQVGEHTVDRNAAVGPASAGALAGAAQGGDAVWVNKLTPAEREALKEFYK